MITTRATRLLHSATRPGAEDDDLGLPQEAKVLIVDDNVDLAEVVRDILRDRFQVTAVSVCVNGQMAAWEIDRGINTGKPFDLVISDWTMPGGNGLDLLKTVRAKASTAKLPFIMLTAVKDKQQIVEAAKSGVTAYVTKPLSEAVLVKKIQELFA
jgi:two-component system chemotaxis response regulator CheY